VSLGKSTFFETEDPISPPYLPATVARLRDFG
jgi:hypothetical protein